MKSYIIYKFSKVPEVSPLKKWMYISRVGDYTSSILS